MRKLLLHVCCAGCCAEIVKRLKKDYELVLYFFNPNIYPREEYLKRLNGVMKIANEYGIKLEEGEYDHKKWLEYVKGHENEKEGERRCELCIIYRMRSTVEKAKNENFDMFAVSLGISPYKNLEFINDYGKKVMQEFFLGYLDENFRKEAGFQESIKHCKENEIYLQHYCGCEFSMKK